jgi:hypothetical protein
MTLWQSILAFLASLAAEPGAVEAEHPRAAAAVAVAYAAYASDDDAPPAPAECVCGGTCRNGVWKPDGRIEQPCPCTCERCKKKPGAPAMVPMCPDGRCRVPGASPATVLPASPNSRR